MKPTEIATGDVVKLRRNPNPVEVLFKVEQMSAFMEDWQVVGVNVSLRPIKDFPLPDDGGRITTDNVRVCNVLEVEYVTDNLKEALKR